YAPRFWTLDPIDGTKGFLRQEQYAVSLALVIDGQIEVALLGCPNLAADAGPGTLSHSDGRGQGEGSSSSSPPGAIFYATRGAGRGGRWGCGDRRRDGRAGGHPLQSSRRPGRSPILRVGRNEPHLDESLSARGPSPWHAPRAVADGQPGEVRDRGPWRCRSL